MCLGQQGKAIALHSFDEVDLPQGMASVEGATHDAGDQIIELAQCAGGRESRSPHMEGDVECLVIHPDR